MPTTKCTAAPTTKSSQSTLRNDSHCDDDHDHVDPVARSLWTTNNERAPQRGWEAMASANTCLDARRPSHSSTVALLGVDESVIADCIEALVNAPSSRNATFLIEHFHVSEPKRSQLLVRIMQQGGERYTLSQIKKFVSMGEFSKESVAKCLLKSVAAVKIESTKTAKWLISHFQLERQHITLDNNRIVLKLILEDKWSCAEWLINKFHITLDEFLRLKWEKCESHGEWIDLFTWKMILQVFPGLTADVIKESFLPLVCQSPVIAQIAMKRFPQLTMGDILAFCSSAPFYQFPLATRLWLRAHDPLIWTYHHKLT
ncbi:hypothetical protein Pelo_6908 [Pelomyxa schiedti]|nr:hypothetical protein Pelo_6908 [Pelomyxa schiedti]